jgi:hypothetical protein
MSPRPRSIDLVLTFLLFTFFSGAILAAQQPKVLAPHKPIAPKVDKPTKWLSPAAQRTMVGGLWMTDANFKSAIYLRNAVETDPVTVTPILHLSNGTKYTLPDVKLDPAGIAIININDSLQKQGISSWATLSGYAEIRYTWPWDPFCATIRNVDTAHSVIFTSSLRPATPLNLLILNAKTPAPTHTIEGMWWKQDGNVTGFVALANLSSKPVQASVQVTGPQSRLLARHSVTISPQGMKLIRLPELQSAVGTEGGSSSLRVPLWTSWWLAAACKTQLSATLPPCPSHSLLSCPLPSIRRKARRRLLQ